MATINELYERSLRASRDAWKNSGTLATHAPGMRHDTILPPPAPADEGAAVRVDVASVPSIRALYEKHLRESLSRWKNAGDGVRGPVSR